MTSSVSVDVVVVGAGPAGSAAAITAAMAGLKVLIIEREQFPRSAPGESLHPGVQPLLRQLGVEDAVLSAGFLRFPGHIVCRDGTDTFQAFGSDNDGPWLGFQAWRPEFDAILLNRARDLGVTIWQPCSDIAPLLSDETLYGVESANGTVEAKFVVDATGRWQLLSRWLNLRWTQHGPARFAWFGYAKGTPSVSVDVPRLNFGSDAWTWVARVREDLVQWTHLRHDNERPAADWLPSELKGMRAVGPINGADVTWRIAEHPAGPGYFLTGDAAAILDPASSHGVLKALMSGIQAGYLSHKVLSEFAPSVEAETAFREWMKSWFHHDVSRLSELYAGSPQAG